MDEGFGTKMKEQFTAIILAMSIAISGWMWTLYSKGEEKLQVVSERLSVLEVKKAGISEITSMSRQLTRQTTILERVSKNQERISEIQQTQGKLLERLLVKDELRGYQERE